MCYSAINCLERHRYSLHPPLLSNESAIQWTNFTPGSIKYQKIFFIITSNITLINISMIHSCFLTQQTLWLIKDESPIPLVSITDIYNSPQYFCDWNSTPSNSSGQENCTGYTLKPLLHMCHGHDYGWEWTKKNWWFVSVHGSSVWWTMACKPQWMFQFTDPVWGSLDLLNWGSRTAPCRREVPNSQWSLQLTFPHLPSKFGEDWI